MPQSNIFVPSWHLEDIVKDSNEKEAAAFLNAYAVAFHPYVLTATGQLPAWSAAQSPGEHEAGRVIILPDPSSSQLPGGWAKEAESHCEFILRVGADREKALKAILEHKTFCTALKQIMLRSAERESADASGEYELKEPVCLDDFLGLGVVYLLTLLLSQSMYHYENVEETRFAEFVVEAARFSMLQDEMRTKEQLQLACEQLLESREKFYPVDAHLIDLCLLAEKPQPGELATLAATDHKVNLLCLASAIENVANERPEEVDQLAQAISAGNIGLVGGEYEEVSTGLLPIQSQRWQMEKGVSLFQSLLAKTPAIWGRMRFGLSSQLPLLLKRFDYSGAYHLVLDDGIYPDDEQSHFSWEGRSGCVIPAISRIPLSIDNAGSLLKLPERLAEAMNHDHLACAILARWPKIRNPWFNDLLRVQKYAPVLGQFDTLEHFFDQSEDSGHYTNHEQNRYQTPDLDQLTGRGKPNAISQFGQFWSLQFLQQSYSWLETTTQILNNKNDAQAIEVANQKLHSLCVDLKTSQLDTHRKTLTTLVDEAAKKLATRLVGKGRNQAGFLLLNPLLQERRCVVRFPFLSTDHSQAQVLKLQNPVKYLQLEKDHAIAIVELPSSGFVALESEPLKQATASKTTTPLAGENFLQNDYFHVQVDPDSGGIQKLRLHGSSENLLSERLVFRLDGSSGVVARGQDEWGGSNTEPVYSRMVADSIKTVCTGPVYGEIEISGHLSRTDNDQTLAKFHRKIRVYRGIKRVQFEMEIEPIELPAKLADRSYYAQRFAWSASAAKVTGRLQQSEFILGERRVESTGAIEIEEGGHSVTLVPESRPFYQRTGMRMLDSLLIVHGETKRSFQCEIVIDQPHASNISADVLSPVQVVPLQQLPVKNSAWLYHINSPSVQLIQMQPAFAVTEHGEEIQGYRFDFIETEAKHVSAKFSTFKPAKKAWEIDFNGKVSEELTITEDQIAFECQPCDYLSLLVQF